jgi:phosphopantothenoylcysteine decarboxylase/phosphopantothenate--cysteine ligase
MDRLTGRRIVLGVSGGIAAYKAAELLRLCKKEGADVRVVMTEAATRFVQPLTFAALSGHDVASDLFAAEEGIGHIAIADQAELLVIAPASADVIARLAAGMADDLVTAVALACKAPLLVAPAMNVNMWNHAATRDNLRRLIARGAETVGPATGELACGWVGEGRMAEAPDITEACVRLLAARDLEGVSVLVTAGPTHEPIDPVRYLSNRSSGKMGFALARAAARRGARVSLVAGPVTIDTPAGVTRIDVTTAEEMHREVMARADAAMVIIKAAAVVDHRPARPADHKLKKAELGEAPGLALVANPDILAELGTRSYAARRPILIGFAAETGDVARHAEQKLRDKGCDLLVANDVSQPGAGFQTDTNQVTLFARNAPPEAVPLSSKDVVADRILDRARSLLMESR